MPANPFTPQERDLIRTYMMVPKVFATPHTGIEGLMDAIDGMWNTDDAGATQASIRSVLASLQALEVIIANYRNLTLSTEVEGEIKIDAMRSLIFLRNVDGPAYINQLASRLAFDPSEDYFSGAKLTHSGKGGRIKYHRTKTNY